MAASEQAGFEISTNAIVKAFDGEVHKLSHWSPILGCKMSLNVFLPPVRGTDNSTVPCLFYLAGLTCTGDNGLEKGGFLAHAAQAGLSLVFPDTSPRGVKVEGDDESWDFGTGAGFYVNATNEPWSKNYKMEDYIVKELPEIIKLGFERLDLSRLGVFGHSMGGHGALTLYFRYPQLFSSVSAFAPICNPLKCPWGKKAFAGYFGSDAEKQGKEHDATELIANGRGSILIDVGTGDQFYKDKQLLPENLFESAKTNPAVELKLNYRDGYDHSYYFISTFAESHIEHHARLLYGRR